MLRRLVESAQFTSLDFTSALADHGIKISMDWRGSWRDNVFVERLWRSIKYEEAYLHACESVNQAKAGIGRYIEFYNTRRPHSTLNKNTPDEFYFASLPALPKQLDRQCPRCPPTSTPQSST